jgi:HD-GYP domain-containing protein (c-di-GMP phosphodiesterase class II)
MASGLRAVNHSELAMSVSPNATSTQGLTLAYGQQFLDHALWLQLNSHTLRCVPISSIEQAEASQASLILLDQDLLQQVGLDDWRTRCPNTVFLSEAALQVDTDLVLSDGLPSTQTRKLIRMACENWLARERELGSALVLQSLEGNLNKLASVGIALAAENDLATLLRKILSEGQNISNCDAASLFLVDKDNKSMTFKLTQNDSIDFPFQENKFKLDAESISGYVAQNKAALNIADAYNIPPESVFQFNSSFDTSSGYETISMLTLPALNKKKNVIAVLQFINKKRARQTKLTPGTNIRGHVLPFDDESFLLLQALAGQAGVAIENAILHNDIQKLFEGFVKASVMAIEQRDPTTSGHSFRVADLCVALARAVNLSPLKDHQNNAQNETQVRELRYAALLHDFGKVGVRESVLVKAKKLSQENIQSIHFRILLAKEKLKNKALKQQLQMHKRGSFDAEKNMRIELNLAQELEKLDQFFVTIVDANEPLLLAAGKRTDLNRIAAYCNPFERSHGFAIVSPEEFSMLAIPKGSLSPEERREIESHVTHTRNFLSLIPWTDEFKQVPAIAGAHHEKLDGSGYPDGKVAVDIPFASKIMTICDIYDALTASDRPYKASVSAETALDILHQEAKAGTVDKSLIDVFTESDAYKTIEGKEYSEGFEGDQQFRHHVCDFDLHEGH